VSGEVNCAVGGEDAGEDAEVVGDALGEGDVGGGSKVDGAAGGVLLLKILKEFAVIGEVGDVEAYGGGDVPFEGSFAVEEPTGEFEQFGRVMAGQGER
jgi:hypothetical protein